MEDKRFNVLFLCTGNSARSIMAEALLNRRGNGRFKAYSAGSHPKGKVHPQAVDLLTRYGFNPQDYRSKSWDEFGGDDAPKMDFVFTVCDNAANEACPIWLGQPMSAHWGIKDPDQPDLPADVHAKLFQKTFRELDHRIKIFTVLPLDKLEMISLQQHLDEIGRSLPDDER